jgi:hypothetical protein
VTDQGDIAAQFLSEIEVVIRKHRRAYGKDALLYQGIKGPGLVGLDPSKLSLPTIGPQMAFEPMASRDC